MPLQNGFHSISKFIYSEKATKFCEISTFMLIVCTVVKSKVEISQNYVAFSEYMNFTADSDFAQKLGITYLFTSYLLYVSEYLYCIIT